jgi:hypothetical protein
MNKNTASGPMLPTGGRNWQLILLQSAVFLAVAVSQTTLFKLYFFYYFLLAPVAPGFEPSTLDIELNVLPTCPHFWLCQ